MRRVEENYDIYDPEYLAWLTINYPDKVPVGTPESHCITQSVVDHFSDIQNTGVTAVVSDTLQSCNPTAGTSNISTTQSTSSLPVLTPVSAVSSSSVGDRSSDTSSQSSLLSKYLDPIPTPTRPPSDKVP